MKEAIINKNFINFLEKKTSVSELSFKEFDSNLWLFLCSLKWNEKVRLANQLENDFLTDYKTNIGNLRLQILTDLGIYFIIK